MLRLQITIFLSIVTTVLTQISSSTQRPSSTPRPATNPVTGKKIIRMGMLFVKDVPMWKPLVGYRTSASAVLIAEDRIREEHLLDDYEFEYSIHFDECDESTAVGLTVEEIVEHGVDLIVGPVCNSPAIASSVLASFYELPIFLWGGATASTLGDSARFPTAMIMSPNNYMLGKAVQAVMEHYKWSQFALLYSTAIDKEKRTFLRDDIQEAITDSITVDISFLGELGSATTAEIKWTLQQLKSRARIIVVCLDEGDGAKRRFMLTAKDVGMLTDEYVYIFADSKTRGYDRTTVDGTTEHMWQDAVPPNDGRDQEALEAFQKTFVISDLMDAAYDNANYTKFEKEVLKRMADAPFNCTTDCEAQEYKSIAVYAGQLHDAVMLYAYALNKTLDSSGPDQLRNGSRILLNSQLSFEGQTGTVTMSPNGSRLPIYYFVGLNETNQMEIYANVFVNGFIDFNFTSLTTNEKCFFTYKGVVPPAIPKCGFSNEKCPPDFMTSYGIYVIIVACILLIAFMAGMIGVIYVVRSKLREEQSLLLLWQIPYLQLNKITLKKRDVKSVRSLHSEAFSISTNHSSVKEIFAQQQHTGRYTVFTYERDRVMGVKHSLKARIDKSDCIEMRMMRQIEHNNLNRFIGLSIDGPQVLSIWKLCSRGTLHDTITNGSMRMDGFFMYSLMRDIANGLHFLHRSSLEHHGGLTSETVLVDDRWQAKITLYGLRTLRRKDKRIKKDLLWTAPELLRDDDSHGTKQGDIYSYGIICSEILMRTSAWDLDNRKERVEEVLYVIKKGLNPPLRPEINLDDVADLNPTWLHLIRDCWSEIPDSRPDIQRLMGMIKAMNSGRTGNLMDHVFAIMEQQAEALEQEIEERTKELVDEKKKSDVLLNRMLPKSVAEKLKLGLTVDPESFDSVTIFFCDVVAFTKLAAKCSPMQVVTLLNDLYSIFDGLIETHDVYKVETIGDGYLCVSGLPKRNGNEHIKEISNLSLQLLKNIASFRVSHLPEERIQLRIGIHTGPCVAGVVGLTMPRYCLFGDTVNTASRMESNGKASFIHISPEAHDFLHAMYPGKYATESRGDVSIKGKGVMETHWLLGGIGEFPINTINNIDTTRRSISPIDNQSKPENIDSMYNQFRRQETQRVDSVEEISEL